MFTEKQKSRTSPLVDEFNNDEEGSDEDQDDDGSDVDDESLMDEDNEDGDVTQDGRLWGGLKLQDRDMAGEVPLVI